MRSIYRRILGLAYILSNLDLHNAHNIVESHMTPITEPKIKQNFKHSKTFYQDTFINKNVECYNKGIPRDGKKTRGKYISMQVKNRYKRKMIRKGLLDKI